MLMQLVTWTMKSLFYHLNWELESLTSDEYKTKFRFSKSDILTLYMMLCCFQKKSYVAVDLKFQVFVHFAYCWNVLLIHKDSLTLYQALDFLYLN